MSKSASEEILSAAEKMLELLEEGGQFSKIRHIIRYIMID